MDFHIPHPFENIGDAIKDALNPDTPADGGLVTQLMNENNRAIEDTINSIPASPTFAVFQGTYNIAMVAGVLGTGVWSSLSGASTSGAGILPSTVGLWGVNAYCRLYGTPGDLFEPSISNGTSTAASNQATVRTTSTGKCSIALLVGLVGGFPLTVNVQYDAGADWSLQVIVAGMLALAT